MTPERSSRASGQPAMMLNPRRHEPLVERDAHGYSFATSMSGFIVHFPDGSKEFRYPARPLEEGDVVWHEGARYRVLAVTEEDGRQATVTVEPDSDDVTDLLTSERGSLVLELLPVTD